MTQSNIPPQGPFGQPEHGPQGVPPAQPMAPSFIPPTVLTAATGPKPRKGSSTGTIAFGAAMVIAAAGLGFAGGRLTAPASASTGRANFANGGFAGGAFANGSFNPGGGTTGRGFGAGAFGAGSISIDGQVTAVGNGTITLQTSGGQSVTVEVPSTVTYHAQASAAPTDVTVGSKVQVSVGRFARPEASGQPAPSGQPGTALGGASLSASDITILSK